MVTQCDWNTGPEHQSRCPPLSRDLTWAHFDVGQTEVISSKFEGPRCNLELSGVGETGVVIGQLSGIYRETLMYMHSVSWEMGVLNLTRNRHKNATLQKVRRQLTAVANQAKSPGYYARQ